MFHIRKRNFQNRTKIINVPNKKKTKKISFKYFNEMNWKDVRWLNNLKISRQIVMDVVSKFNWCLIKVLTPLCICNQPKAKLKVTLSTPVLSKVSSLELPLGSYQTKWIIYKINLKLMFRPVYVMWVLIYLIDFLWDWKFCFRSELMKSPFRDS